MRNFKVEDIETWESEAGEDFFDQNGHLINGGYLLGFILGRDKEVYDAVMPLINREYGEPLTVRDEFGPDGENPNPELYRKFQELFLEISNISEVHNERMTKVFGDYSL